MGGVKIFLTQMLFVKLVENFEYSYAMNDVCQ